MIKHKQEDISNAEKAGMTSTTPEKSFEVMLNAIRDSMSDLASSDDEEHREDEDNDEEEDTDLGKLSEDDQLDYVIGTISKCVQYRTERFWQKQMKHDEMMQQGWGDTADIIGETVKNYWTAELKIPAVNKTQKNKFKVAPTPTIYESLVETPDINPGVSQIPQTSSRPVSCHRRLGSVKRKSNRCILSLSPIAVPD